MSSYEMVVVGTSLGGVCALQTLLGGLSVDFPLPVIIVQHRSAESDDQLMRTLLQDATAIPVLVPEDKEAILPGRIYVAPAGYHLLVEKGAFALSTAPPVVCARPSIDVLFESAADAYRDGVIGIILTGANKDGAAGAAAVKQRGGLLVVQEPGTSESAVLPKATISATPVDRILPVAEIPAFLTEALRLGGHVS